MKTKNLIICFILFHVIFIFLQIHKQSYFVELSYKKQKNEKIKQELLEKKNNLTQQWYMMQNKTDIKKYAQEKLGMKKVSLHQIKQLPS